MRKPLLLAIAGLALVAATMPQDNVVKAGVDAWATGEYKQAVETWRAPAVGGDADAQFNMGQAYKLGRGVPVDLAMAEEWYRKAAAQGHPQAEDNYGLSLFQNGKVTEAIPWLEKSSARGEARAQFVLGTVLFNGDIAGKDWVRAYALMVRANATGLPQAAQTLAQMDRYIDTKQRQAGLALARRYESDAGKAVAAVPFTPAPTPAPKPVTAPPTKLAAAPRPKPAAPQPKPPAPTATTDGGWRIQLGAFRDAGNARSLWGKVSGIGGLAGTKPYYVQAGAMTRVLVGPFATNGDASRACAAVKRSGQPCLAVRG